MIKRDVILSTWLSLFSPDASPSDSASVRHPTTEHNNSDLHDDSPQVDQGTRGPYTVHIPLSKRRFNTFLMAPRKAFTVHLGEKMKHLVILETRICLSLF